ncbi:LamG-like jellyroll fold domain-containing protein [Streptomyces sp. Act-28]
MKSVRDKNGWGRLRGLVGGGLAVALLAVPGTAQAATGLPPLQPLVQELETGGRPCAAGDARPYVDGPPTLGAVLRDPEEDDRPGETDSLKGEFEAWWTDAYGVEQRLAYTTYTTASSGTRQEWRMPQGVPANTVVSWHVRATDGTAVSAWSDEGEGTVCQFVYDDASPQAPTVASPDYPDAGYHDGVGVYASFTVDSPSEDVVAYRYEFLGGTPLTVRPEEPGGPATIRHLPLKPGPDRLGVRAVDRSGRVSATVTYDFAVKAGRAPVAHWLLSDAPGSTTAAAESGPAARVGSGVVFGAAGPRGASVASVAALDGSGHAFVSPDAPVLDLRKTFAVSAWARPASTDRDMTVASQDAGDDAGFVLGLRTGGQGPLWSFAIGGVRVSGGAPEAGEWAHLLGLYDAETGQSRLYVNGHEVDAEAGAVPSGNAGAFQIGRARGNDGYRDRWHGEVGDVRVHDRVAVADEITGFAHRRPDLLGHWSLEDAADGASPERGGGEPLLLGPGASIHRGPDGSCIPDLDPDCPDVPGALVGDGHLRLDGATGHATTGTTVVDTEDSFTIGVVVRLTDSAPDRPMTVLSQAGEHTDAFKVRYDPSAQAWQLVMAQYDEVGAPETVVSQISAAEGGTGPGCRLAVVYDDATDQMRLYLDGQTGPDATASLPDGLRSTGALQVGRAKAGEGWSEYLHGDVDEVQAYAGALSDRQVQQLGSGVSPSLG